MNAYEFLGQEAGIRRLVDRFYELMDSLPVAATIRAMHPADLEESADKLALFLVERFGGPSVYSSQRGHPRLRARHMPFAVDAAAAEAWMACMRQALEEQVRSGPERDELVAFFDHVANHMRNRD
jgi:hemoglobin